MSNYSDSFERLTDEFFSFKTEGKPEIVIYSNHITNRLAYTCDFIFKQGLKINYQLTNNREEFKNSSLPKINYSDAPDNTAFGIAPSGLLIEEGIRNFHPAVEKKNGKVYFFGVNSDLHFDIFSAVFYFISRYEEWLDFEKDNNGRFEIKASLLYKAEYYRSPIVDEWILELKGKLSNRYPELKFPKKKFRVLSTIDVDNVYAFKTKPFGRMAGASLKDFLKLNFANISHRLQTRYFAKPDPFDAYELQAELSKKYNVPLVYFFLCRHNTAYDRTISPEHPLFKQLTKTISDKKIPVGLHPSYFTSDEPKRFNDEAQLLSSFIEQPVVFSRQHYLKFNIRETPKHLIQAGIKYDFTMGYSSEPGYRAGTTLPFYYYDLAGETALPLLAVPFALMDGAYYLYKKMSAGQAEADIIELSEKVRMVNGLFVTVYHDRSFWEESFPGWKELYIKLHEFFQQPSDI